MGTQVSIAGARPNQISYPARRRRRQHPGERLARAAPPAACSASIPSASSRCSSTTTAPSTAAAPAASSSPSRARAPTACRDPVFEFGRNSTFDSRTYFDDPTRSIPPLKRNQFGGTLGGPIVRDKTFFFASYEGLRQTQGRDDDRQRAERRRRARAPISAPRRVPTCSCIPRRTGRRPARRGSTSSRSSIRRTRTSRSARSTTTSRPRTVDLREVLVRQGAGRSGAGRSRSGPPTRGRSRSPSSASTTGSRRRRAPEQTSRSPGTRPTRPPHSLENRVVRSQPASSFPDTRFGTINVSGLNSLGPDTQSPTFVEPEERCSSSTT